MEHDLLGREQRNITKVSSVFPNGMFHANRNLCSISSKPTLIPVLDFRFVQVGSFQSANHFHFVGLNRAINSLLVKPVGMRRGQYNLRLSSDENFSLRRTGTSQ